MSITTSRTCRGGHAGRTRPPATRRRTRGVLHRDIAGPGCAGSGSSSSASATDHPPGSAVRSPRTGHPPAASQSAATVRSSGCSGTGAGKPAAAGRVPDARQSRAGRRAGWPPLAWRDQICPQYSSVMRTAGPGRRDSTSPVRSATQPACQCALSAGGYHGSPPRAMKPAARPTARFRLPAERAPSADVGAFQRERSPVAAHQTLGQPDSGCSAR